MQLQSDEPTKINTCHFVWKVWHFLFVSPLFFSGETCPNRKWVKVSGLVGLNSTTRGRSRRKYHRHLPQQASTGVGKLLDWWGPQWVLNPKTCCFNVYWKRNKSVTTKSVSKSSTVFSLFIIMTLKAQKKWWNTAISLLDYDNYNFLKFGETD